MSRRSDNARQRVSYAMTVIANTNPPVCMGRSFIVTAIARNQSFPCGGCFYKPKTKGVKCSCKAPLFDRPYQNFKVVKDGETVIDTKGNLYYAYKCSDTKMMLLPHAKEVEVDSCSHKGH